MIKIYLNVLLPVGMGAIIVFSIGLYFILRKPLPKLKTEPAPHREPPADLTAIAGDDVMTTQLDLARAFIETGRTQSAQQILQHVAEQGNAAQQAQAQQLMAQLCVSP